MKTFEFNYLAYGLHNNTCTVHQTKISNVRYGDMVFICFEVIDDDIFDTINDLVNEIILELNLEPENVRFFMFQNKISKYVEVCFSWVDIISSTPKWFNVEFDLNEVFKLI